MKQNFSKILILILITRSFISCDATKRVSENDYLLTKNTIVINNEKNKDLTINSQLTQQPNQKILGIPLGLHIYNTARPNRDSLFNNWINKNPKRKNHLEKIYSKKQVQKIEKFTLDFNKWIKNTGDSPVVISEEKTKKSAIRLKNHFINNGWFDAKVTYTIDKKDKKRAEINYNIETGKAFIIDSIKHIIKSTAIEKIYNNIKANTLIVKGEQYKTTNFEKERERISTELRNSGVYHFNQDYINFEIDTIGTNKKVNVNIQILDRAVKTPDSIRHEPFKIYHIDEVNIITDYTFDKRGKPFLDSIKYNGFKFYAYKKIKYRPKTITDAIFINPGTVFKDIDRTRTYRYINELRNFKYPNIEYVEYPNYSLKDTIRLTPLKKFSFGFSTDVSQSNIQKVGLSGSPSLVIRNIFKGTENLQISGIASIGSSAEGRDLNDPFFDINEYGFDVKLTIPRILSPFYTEKIIPKYMSPSTMMSVSTTSQTNIGLDKQTLSGTFNYNWYPNSKTTNKLDLFNIQYVKNLNTDNYFGVYRNSYNVLNQIARDVNFIGSQDYLNLPNSNNTNIEVDQFINYALNTNSSAISSSQYSTINAINERKNRLIEDNLILSSSFSFKNDERTNIFDNNFSIFRFKIEFAGNLLANISNYLGIEKDQNNRYKLFNVAYSQYGKTELDYIKHFDLGNKNVLAMRSFFGIAIPYGNSTNIPFARSFFAGGPNDNRAWGAYSLGPGSSKSSNEFNEANLKIALSVEQRFNIFQNLYGAVFVDAGNIWNILDDVKDENATFSDFKSIKDIAIGSGLGLRYDFTFFVFRFDIGFKTYNPMYLQQDRWFNDYNFNSAVYNIGINYPF